MMNAAALASLIAELLGRRLTQCITHSDGAFVRVSIGSDKFLVVVHTGEEFKVGDELHVPDSQLQPHLRSGNEGGDDPA